jgi:hypothetical protein
MRMPPPTPIVSIARERSEDRKYLMNTHAPIVSLLICMSYVNCVRAQGTFQDLDFEEATVSGYQPVSVVPTTAAFPGWEVYSTGAGGTTPLSSVWYDGVSLGGAAVSIIDNYPPFGLSPLDGNYSAFLFGGGPEQNLSSVSISQTGTVPPGTLSIQFDGNVSGAPFTVTLGNTTIDMVPLQSFVHYDLWGGNIPASMAGQSETLTITEPPPIGTVPPSMFELDDITFSTTSVIPEPSPLALAGIGSILFALYRQTAQRRQSPFLNS